MAEVSTFHQPNDVVVEEQEQEQEQDSIPSGSNDTVQEDDLYAFDFNPLSPPNISFFIPSSSTHSRNFTTYSDSHTDSDSYSDSDPNCSDGESDQMNFVTDLFASRREEEFVVDDQYSVSENFRVFGGDDGFGEELGLGFGVDVGLVSELGESSATRGANSTTEGLRVVGIESDSDSEDANSRIHESPLGDSDNPLFWDCLGFEEQRADNEELDWEESRVVEREGLSSVIDRIGELSVSSEVSSNEEASDIDEETARNLEWEFLLAVSNLERAPEFEHNDGNGDGVSYLALRDDYVYAAEYDTIFGQFVHNESALKGSPPAAKSVVENLASVVLTKEELQENNLVCAVCKDEILEEEKVTRLPCCHHYHGDCIVPWLNIRNTCPVCRYELPTDDLDYEQRKTQLGGLGLSQDLQVILLSIASL